VDRSDGRVRGPDLKIATLFAVFGESRDSS